MVITRTPYAVSWLGGGTDSSDWYPEHGGLILGSTLRRYCYISCRKLPPFFHYKTRLVYSRTEEVDELHQIQHTAIRGFLTRMKFEEGLEVHHDGDLPARSGLGSGSSFSVGFLLGLHTLRHQMPTHRKLATMAIEMERNILKEKDGMQDQILAAHGGLRTIHISKNGKYETHPLALSPDYLKCLEDQVLLGHLGSPRKGTKGPEIKVPQDQLHPSTLQEIQSFARQGVEVLSREGDWKEMGQLLEQEGMARSQAMPPPDRNLIRDLLRGAEKEGAYGGKALGSAKVGFLMLLAPPQRHAKIKSRLSKIRTWIPFKVDYQGSQVIFHEDHRD